MNEILRGKEACSRGCKRCPHSMEQQDSLTLKALLTLYDSLYSCSAFANAITDSVHDVQQHRQTATVVQS
jgi:hypothetical protein